MDLEKNNFLAMCCKCPTIRVSNEFNLWLSQNDNSRLYNLLVESYGKNISHGYCPKHYEEAMSEIEKYKSNLIH